MKLVGVENNIVYTSGSPVDSDFLIVSDQPIKKHSYYFELELQYKQYFYSNSAAAVAFIEKDQNNEFVKSGFDINYYHNYYRYPENYLSKITKRYYNNSLNLELGFYLIKAEENTSKHYLNELSIYNDDDKPYDTINSSVNNNYHETYYDNNEYYRLGLGIDIDLDNKKTTINYYSNSTKSTTIDKHEKLLRAKVSINKIFDPNRLYIVIYPQYVSCQFKHNNGTNETDKLISKANYKFFFNKDEMKYTHLYENYNRLTVVEKLGGGVYGKMSDNNFQKLSDHKWDEISKDEKLSLLEQTKGLVPSIDQLKTLDQPIRVITKAES